MEYRPQWQPAFLLAEIYVVKVTCRRPPRDSIVVISGKPAIRRVGISDDRGRLMARQSSSFVKKIQDFFNNLQIFCLNYMASETTIRILNEPAGNEPKANSCSALRIASR